MDTALTPLEFARRTRRLHPDREAVVDGDLRLTYRDLFDRCDRWSAALQAMGVGRGDRVAYIAPNTHAQLESFYAVPQLGAVLVPINYRLSGDDFAYIIGHSGARIVCAGRDHLDAVDAIRTELPDVDHFVRWTAPARAGWTTRSWCGRRPRTSPGRPSPSRTSSRSTTRAARPPGPRA